MDTDIAGRRERRYAMKPMPAKPRIIIAHVDGSGTDAGILDGAVVNVATWNGKEKFDVPKYPIHSMLFLLQIGQ